MSDDEPGVVVPDDLSGLEDTPPAEPGGRWMLVQRLLLKSGEQLTSENTLLDHEPHLGDVHATVANQVLSSLNHASHSGSLLFLPFDEPAIYLPLGNVQGVFVDVIAPGGGTPIHACNIKTGYFKNHDGPQSAVQLGDGADMWEVEERLKLDDGFTLTRLAHRFSREPHLENIKLAGRSAAVQLGAARESGVLRFLPSDDSMFFTLLDNVRGVSIAVVSPDGTEIDGCDLKPGWAGTSND